jgi:hypothetical protein
VKPEFIVITENGVESVCITGGGPTLAYRSIIKWADVQRNSVHWGLPIGEGDVKAWPRMAEAEADSLFGEPLIDHDVMGGLTMEQAIEAAFQGAQRAERE